MHIGAHWCEIISKVVDSRFLLDSYLRQKQFKFLIQNTVHRGTFCQFSFRWIHSCHSSKSTGNETGKTHLCALLMFLSLYPETKKFNNIINIKAIFSFFVNNVGILRVKLFIKIIKLLLFSKVKIGDTITVTYWYF